MRGSRVESEGSRPPLENENPSDTPPPWKNFFWIRAWVGIQPNTSTKFLYRLWSMKKSFLSKNMILINRSLTVGLFSSTHSFSMVHGWKLSQVLELLPEHYENKMIFLYLYYQIWTTFLNQSGHCHWLA